MSGSCASSLRASKRSSTWWVHRRLSTTSAQARLLTISPDPSSIRWLAVLWSMARALLPNYFPHQSAFSVILRIQTLNRSTVLSMRNQDYFLIDKGPRGSVSSFGLPDFVVRQDSYFDNALVKANDAVLISAVITARSKELVPPL